MIRGNCNSYQVTMEDTVIVAVQGLCTHIRNNEKQMKKLLVGLALAYHNLFPIRHLLSFYFEHLTLAVCPNSACLPFTFLLSLFGSFVFYLFGEQFSCL